MASTDFNESNFDFSNEQSLVSNPLDANNAAHNHNSSGLLTSEIIFVDETVKDYQQLVAQIDADVYRLDSNLDGIEQITEVLSQYEDISGVHLISHGDEGSLKLGATELNQENLKEYGDRLKLWNNSLLDDADFLIYGCDVAQGEAGEDFVKDLGSLIGADIAASNDLTGSKDLGGDWDLEYATGEIEAEGIVSYDYQDVLATVSLDNGVLTYDSDGTITDTATDGTVSLIGYENDLDIYINNNELYIQEDNGFLFTLLDYPEAITAGTNVTQVDDYTVKVDLSSVTGISVQTNDGQDSITLDSSFSGFTGSFNLDAGSVTDGDSVVINSDLFTAGNDLSIQAESITIPQNTTISTRKISETDHLSDASTGNSGAIDFDARTLSLDGTNLYAHVLDDDTTNTAGNIDIHVKEEAISTVFGGFDTFDVDVSLDPVDVNVDIGFDSADDSTATLDLIGANLLGADITLDANASYDEDSFLSTIDNYSLFLGAAIVEATAKVNIDSNSTINAASLTANALTNTDAISTPVSLGIDIGIAYGSLDATAEVVIDGNVDVDGDLNLSTTSDNTIDVEADVGGYQNVAGAVAISEVNTTSKAQIGTTANIDVKGDLNIDADTIDQNYTLARSTTGDDGNVGIAASVSLENGSTEALLDSQNTTVAGNITLDADQSSGAVPKYTDYYTAGGVAAFANVGSDSTGDLVTDTQFGILGSVLNGAKGLKNLFSSKSDAVEEQTEGASSSFDLGAAVAYASDINNVTARIGDGAVVKSSGGSIDLDATATNRPNVSAGSGVSGSGGSSSTDTTNESSEFAGSAAVAIGDYNNNTYAYIGDGATVDAQQAIDLKSESLNDYETSWGINLVSPFTDDSLEDDDRFPTFIANFASYLNDNLGLDNYVFDSWSQATAEGADVGIAGAVTWLDLNHISEAYIGNNAQINQDDTLRSDLQTVAVNAESINEAVHLGGNVQVPLGIMGNFNSFLTIPEVNDDVRGTNNGSGVGGTVLVVNYDNDTKAKIGDGVKLYADSLEVDADTTAMSVSLAASGGEAQKFGFNGTGTWFFIDNDTIAQIHSGADITVKDKAVEGNTAALVVDATDKTDVINMSGGVAVSENIGIGASISFNTVDRNTQAIIGTLDDETAPTTKQKLIVDGDVDLDAQNEGYIGSFALAAAVSTTETHEQPESMDNYESVSADDSDTSWGIGISGEASINEISDTTNAYISDIDVESSDLVNIEPDINLTAVNISEILSIGGSVAIALADEDNKTSAGLAGSFGKNTINNTTKAYVSNSVINSRNLTVLANNDVEILSVNASGAGNFNDKGYALAGSVAINDITNDTSAYINNNSQVTVDEDVNLTATDSSTIFSVAGALQYSGQYGIGASIGFNLTNNTTKAYIEDSDLDATNLNVNATNTNTIHAFAVAAGASHNGMAAEFSLTYNSTENTTEAYIDNGDDELDTNLSGNLSVNANDDAEIFSLAGVLGFSLLTGSTDNYAATIGVSIAINEIENQTKARIKDGRVVVEGDLELIADSTADIQAYSIAGSGSASFNSSGLVFAGAGAGTWNKVNNTIEASVNDLDNTNNIDTYVDVAGTTNLSATDNATITADAGGAAISLAIAGDSWSSSAALSVGAGVASNEITNTVTAYIDDAKVDSDGAIALTAQSNSTIDAFALGAAVSGNFSSSGVGVSITGAGAGTENIIRNNISAYIADGSDVQTTASDAGIAVTANDNSDVTADAGGYALSLKFGNGMVNGSASVGVSVADNDIANTVQAYVGNSIVTSAAGVDINATSTSTIDLLSIGAAASGSIGSSGFNGSLSGAGTRVENRIASTIEAFVNNNSTVTSTNGGAIDIKATDDSTIVADAGGFAVAVSIGSGFSGGVTAGVANAKNEIKNTVRAYIDNAVVTAAGDLTLDATATSDIDNLTMAGAVSVAISDSATLAAAGGDTYTHNDIGNTIEAFIQNDSDVTSNGSIAIDAKDDSTIESVAVGGSISVSGSSGVSFALSVTSVEVNNIISNQVRAYIGDISTDSTTVDAANDLNLTADSTLTFNDNYAVAVALAAAVAPSGAALSGGGANVITTTSNTVEAFVRNLTTTDAVQADNVNLTATDTPTIKPTVGSGSLAASFIGASVSVSLTDTTIDNNVRTYIDNSKVTTTNDVALDATSTPNIESEAVTTSIAAAVGGAGAGGEVTVTISSDVASYINNDAVVDANDVAIDATQTPTVTADVVGVAVSSIAAVGVSVTDVEFNGTTKAYIDKADVITSGNLDVTATATPSFDADVTAVAAGILTSGAGNEVKVKDTSSTEAYITNAADIDITSTLTITATAQPKLAGDALGVSAAAGIQAGGSVVEVEVSPDITSYIGSNADIAASNFNLTAQQILPDTGISAEADASASGGALYGSVNAATAEAKNTASTTINIDSGAVLNISNTATLQTNLNSSQDAFADGYNGGILARGFNNAVAESDTSNNINLDSGSTVNADISNVYVNGDDYNYAEAVAGGGGVVSGRAAEAETKNTSDTQANIDGKITVNTIDIAADRTSAFNAKTDSTNASLVGASGAYSENTVDANVEVNFSNSNYFSNINDSDRNVIQALDDFDVTINNNIEQAALSDENAEAASGGVLDGSAVETVTTITNTSNINVNDNAVLSVGDEDYDTVNNMDFAILNDVRADVKSKLNSGGLISEAKADATVTNNTNQAYINIGDADITSTHDLNFSTRAIADLEADANAKAYGLSGVSKGDTLAEANVDNQINLNSGASVTAEGDVNFSAGEDKDGNVNNIQVNADTNLWNKSASPMYKRYIGADGNITLNNAIAINSGAAVSSGQDLNLISNNNDGSYNAEASGEGTDVYSQIASGIASIFGADVSSVITNDSTSETFTNGVTVDGSITAGVDNIKSINIANDYSVATNDETITVTESTVNLAEEIENIINALEAEITAIDNNIDGQKIDSEVIQAEIDFWQQELNNLGVTNSTKVLETSDISVAVGNINVTGNYLVGSGNLEAKGDALISIINNSDAYLRVNDAYIDDNYGGQLLFNNAAIATNSDLLVNSDLVNFSNITTSDSENTETKIVIENNHNNGSVLEIKGALTNRNGSVEITNEEGTIYVSSGVISAKTIDIDSGASFYLSDGYSFSVGSSPEAIWNDETQDFINTLEEAHIYDLKDWDAYEDLDDSKYVFRDEGSSTYLDYEITDNSLIQDKLDEASNGSLVAESSIFIDANYINVAGDIQSGIADYNLTLNSDIDSIIDDFETEQTTFSELAEDLNAIADLDSLDALNGIDLPENSYIYGDSIYFLSEKEDFWHHTKGYAENWGGSLVTINNEDEQDWLYDTFGGNERLWIGLTDDPDYGGSESRYTANPETDGWVWANGEELTYTNWNSGEPNDSGHNENYVQMELSGFWNDNDNYANNSADLVKGIIEIPLSNYGISHDVYAYNDRFYILSDAGTWQEAQMQAASLGGNLVTIDNESEQAWIESNFGGSEQLWIGLQDRNQEGEFAWIDGSAVGYTNWNDSEPNDSGTGEDYAILRTDGLWNDRNSDGSFRGIIELSANSEVSIASQLDLSDYFLDSYGNNIDANYNSDTQRIEVEDVEVSGGYVQLVGNIVNAASGSIQAMDGFGSIAIDNQTDYELELGNLNTGGEGIEGQIKIIDLSQTGYNDDGSTTNLSTTYTQDANGDIRVTDNSTTNGVTQTYSSDTVNYVLSDRDIYYQWQYYTNDDVALSTPDTTSNIYERYDGKLYFLTEDKGSWTATQTDALGYGGNLVTINSEAEQNWLTSKFSSFNQDFWIGYTDQDSEGNFEWISGESSDYTNWSDGEPNDNGSGEDYVHIYPSGYWNDDGNDDHSYNGIVEYDAATYTRTYDSGDEDGFKIKTLSDWHTDNPIFSSTATAIEFSDGDPDNLVVTDRILHRVYRGTVPVNNDIAVGFIGNDSGSIQVNSNQTVWLNDNLTNLSGDTTINSSSGSVRSLAENEINAENLTINSNGSIGDSDIEIDTDLEGGALNATATGDIYIDETQGDLTVDTVSTSGNVDLEAYGNLEANSSTSKVTGQEISLTSETGNIGSDSLDVKIDSDSSETGTGGVTLNAANDINVTETAGDVYLASANASNGDVDLSVTSGSIIDYNPEETEDLTARAELLDTLWSEMELTDEYGAASAAAETVEAYEQAKESSYELYWQYRNLTPVYDDDNNLTGYTYDDYDSDYVYSFSDTEEAQLIELGYSDSAIATLAENKTTEYHSLHEELATSGLTDDYDPDYTYTATAEEEAEITEGAVWTTDELTRVINPGLLLPVSDTEVDIEAENVRASNLTLNVGGGIGIDEGTELIDVRNADGSIIGISDKDLLYLLTAEPNDITYLDISGVEVEDPNNNVESIYSIAIEQIDDLDFEATGELNLTTTADAYLGSEANITINDLDVGNNEIRLKSGKGITGTTTSTTHITASNTIIEAGDASIGSETTPIELATSSLTARANNDLYLNQASGDLDTEQIYAGDNVNLTVGGEVRDLNDTDDENIRSTNIDLETSFGSFGSSDNYLDVYLESGGAFNLDVTQDAYIRNTSGTGTLKLDFTGITGTLTYSDGVYTVTDTSFGDAFATSVNFTGFDAIDLYVINSSPISGANSSFAVESLASGTTLNLIGEENNDNFELSNAIEGIVNIDGGTGANTIIINDADDTSDNTYTITDTQITGHITDISHSNIDTINIQGGTGTNDSLSVTNSSDAAQTITADNSSIASTDFIDIIHSGVETIDYYAETGDNAIDTTGVTSSATALTIYSNLGDNENTLDLTAPSDRAKISVAVAENTTNLKVAKIISTSSNYSLSGTDAASFETIGDELHFLTAPDFESQAQYEVTVTDTATNETVDLTIPVTDINEAPSLSLENSTLTLAEDTDTTNEIKIGDVVVSDDALGDNVLSLSGDDAELFELVNDTELYLVAGTSLDYETNPTLDVIVAADDGTFSVPLDASVTVTDVNEAANIDLDYTETYDNRVLTLDGDGDYIETNSDPIDLTDSDFTLEAWVKTTETDGVIIEKADDNNTWESGEKAFFIDSGKVQFSGYGNGSIVGSTAVNDGTWHHVAVVWDAANSQGYVYVDGMDDTASSGYSANVQDKDGDTLKLGLGYNNRAFSGNLDLIKMWNRALTQEEIADSRITATTGSEENLVAYYNFEDDSLYYYNTLVGDTYLEDDEAIIVLAEDTDTSARTKIADIVVDDDALGTNSLSLADDDADLFEIDGTELYLAADANLDYETNPIVNVSVQVDDDTVGNTPDDAIALTIPLTDANDAPAIDLEQVNTELPENVDTSARIEIGEISLLEDALGSDTLSLAGDDAELFEIEDSLLYLQAGATIDYETNPTLDVTVEVDDNTIGDTPDDSVDVSIPVRDVNDIFDLGFTSPANQTLSLDGSGDYVSLNTYAYNFFNRRFTLEAWIKTSATGQQTIIREDDGSSSPWESSFYINDSGQLVFYYDTTYYQHREDDYLVTGKTAVNDGEWHHVAYVSDTDAQEGSLFVDGVNDTASRSGDFNWNDSTYNTIKFGTGAGEFSGEMDEVRIWKRALTQADLIDNFTTDTRLTGTETDLAAYHTFQNDSTTTVFDEVGTVDTYGGDYDGTLNGDAEVISDNSLSLNNGVVVDENSADTSSVKIADITMLSAFGTEDLILTGDDADKFEISGTELSIKAGEILDYETDSEFNFTVELDSTTIDATQDITVTVNNLNELPVIALENTVTDIDENTDTTERIKLADINLTDDSLGTNVLNLSGNEAEYFEIENSVLYLKAGTTLNYENLAAYSVTIEVDDEEQGDTFETSVDFSLDVNDLNETPAITLDADITAIDENTDTTERIKVGDIIVTDEDTSNTNVLSLSGNDVGLFELEGTELYLKAGITINYEANSALDVTVTVGDGTFSVPLNVSVAVTDLNETPTLHDLAKLRLN